MSKKELKTYWRSLQDLSRNEEYQNYINREFPEDAGELKDGYSRRNFLQIMGASVALAGMAACRKPVQKLLPYHEQPEEMVPGNPLTYASSIPFQDAGMGILVTTNEGRPTKIEGNPSHPGSRGASNVFHQASILDLYDVNRSHNPREDGNSSSWDDFVSFAGEHFSDTSRRIAFISEASGSPSFNRMKTRLLEKFPNARWATWEAYGPQNVLKGTEQAFGQKLRPVYKFGQAKVVISLDYDFMNLAPNNVASNMDYADARRVSSVDAEMNRLYVVQNNLSVTGSNADHRLRIKAGDMPHFVAALASELSGRVSGLDAFSGVDNKFSQHSWISVLAQELLDNRGNAIIAAGEDYAPEIHASIAAINLALENAGSTVHYTEVPYHDDSYNPEAIAEVARGLRNGEFDTLVMVGGNPAYDAPADLNMEEAIAGAETSIHLSQHFDETSKLVNWHVNRAHFLEFWGDVASYEGVLSVVQPTIRPLYGAKSEIEFLYAIAEGSSAEGYDIVRETWSPVLGDSFNRRWNEVLHEGLLEDSSFNVAGVQLSSGFGSAVSSYLSGLSTSSEGDIELVIKPDHKVFDGRFANNGWLQEFPDPVTKITWDNVAMLNPATAERLGVSATAFGDTSYELLEITANGTSFRLPAWILPGLADNSITMTTGYGRTAIGNVADDVGHNNYVARTTGNMMVHHAVSVSRTGESYPIACTQNHHQMEDRPLVREATLEEYRQDPKFAAEAVYVPGMDKETGVPKQLFNAQMFPDYEPQWGMAIDLNACTGCGVCTIACQAENNIPVIGKREVERNREMHWIRVDRYFEGDTDDPKVVHQPIPCMHCEQAPCEMVCPVAATVHSDDGLNQMVYNQCIGTRYCSNNCPFKVRRFNFFNYAKNWLEIDEDPDVIQMAMNPDVSVRFRGVMEKCTYCIQRINRGKIETKNETGYSRKPADGRVKTACQQACPTQAITFGDLTDEESVVVKTKRNDRNYLLLEEYNIRPRTSHLAKIRNPNSELA
jgi:molybdopterin-containing oxidoreductase family iron-sulfur binding subunit